MAGSPVSVPLDQLDYGDETFAVRSFLPCDGLKASLDERGILCPPWLWEKENGKFAIVDGFKRLGHLREKGAGRAECFIFEKNFDPAHLMLLRVEGKLFGPPLNPAETAQIIRKISENVSDERVIARCLSMLGISAKPGAVERWRRLAMAGDDLLGTVASEETSERAAFELVSWEGEGDAVSEALSILRKLRCSASIQVEILERVREIAILGSRKKAQVLSDPSVLGILGHSDWNHREKTQALRDLLYGWRFPRLRAREDRFRRELDEAVLSKNMRLNPPPAFEGENWQLQLSFSSPEELIALIEKARRFADSSHLHRIMSPSDPGGGKRSGSAQP